MIFVDFLDTTKFSVNVDNDDLAKLNEIGKKFKEWFSSMALILHLRI